MEFAEDRSCLSPLKISTPGWAVRSVASAVVGFTLARAGITLQARHQFKRKLRLAISDLWNNETH